MLKKSLFLIFIVAFWLQSAFIKKSDHYILIQIKRGIWAAIHNDVNGQAICNAGIIDLGNKTVVVDAFISPLASADLQKDAVRLTGRPVTFLINTHYHNDHTRGNQIFSAPTKIISSSTTKALFLKNDTASLNKEKQYVPKALEEARNKLNHATPDNIAENRSWYNYYRALNKSIHTITSTAPEITFEDSLIISGTKRKIILKEFRKGHSESDVAVIMPEDGVVFMGDLLFHQRHPFLAEGNPNSLYHHLNYFKSQSKLSVLIPGHGPIAARADIDTLQGYIRFIQQTAANAIKHNTPDAEVLHQQLPAPYNSWLLKRFFRPNYLSVKIGLKGK